MSSTENTVQKWKIFNRLAGEPVEASMDTSVSPGESAGGALCQPTWLSQGQSLEELK